jgi:hypothetical protein
MKTLLKTSLLTLIAIVIATSAASADDSQFRRVLEIQRAQQPAPERATTSIAIYTNQRGVGLSERREIRPETRADLHYAVRVDPHGQTYGAYVAAE